jgi:hypothetical protein
MIKQMGEREARELLQKEVLARLGCNIDGTPYVLPINYIFEEDHAYVHSLPGLKIDAMRNDPRVCIQVDEIKDPYHWRSVIAWGDFEEISDEQQKEQVLAQMFRRLPHLTPVESRMAKNPVPSIVFCIRIDKITGVFENW